MQSIVANLHLLLRVPSFARWPLRLHIFVPEVHAAWIQRCESAGSAPASADQPATSTWPINVVADFVPAATAVAAASVTTPETDPPRGIHSLPLDYGPLRNYVDKAQDVFTFERAEDCAVCHEVLLPGRGLYVVCPNDTCEAVGHLQCWSRHLLAEESASTDEVLLPIQGHCPTCGGVVKWADMMKELTLRIRAPEEVAKLVKAKRRQEKADKAAARKASKAAGVVVASDSEDDDPLPITKRATTATTTTTKRSTAVAKKPSVAKRKAAKTTKTRARKTAEPLPAAETATTTLIESSPPDIVIL